MMRGTQEKPLPAFNKLWKPAEKCDRTKLLNLHRPTPISEFKNTIPRPKYRPIKDALPFWEIRELNEKIPMYYKHTPSGPIVFHRGLMGDNPLKSSFKLDFLLNDPHCHEVSNTYNPLHDPHLKHWLTSNNNRKFLHRQGLITDDMDVICNLKEFNEYRRFLWQVHNNITMWRLKSKEEKKIERKKIFNANQNHKNEVAKKLKHLKYIMSKREPQNVNSYITLIVFIMCYTSNSSNAYPKVT